MNGAYGSRRRFLGPQQIACVLILLIHAALSTWYSFTVPVWEANDETGHYAYAHYLATHGHLPPIGVRLAGVDESHQPPLYYAAVALAMRWIDTSDDVKDVYLWTERVKIRPDPRLTQFPACVPACGTALANHVGRLVSVLLTTFAVLCTYLTARLWFPRRGDIALYAMALFGLWPMLLFVGGVLNNDNGIIALGALALLCASRLWVASGSSARVADWPSTLGLALAAGLATLTKDSGVSVVLFAVLVAAALWVRDLAARRAANLAGALLFAVTLVATLVAGYALSDGRTLRQFTGTMNYASSIVNQVTPIGNAAPGSVGTSMRWLVDVILGDKGRWVFDSLFGLFGWSAIRMPQEWYDAARAGAWLAVASAVGAALFDKSLRRAFAFLGVFVACIAAAPVVRAVMSHDSSLLHGRFFLAGFGGVSIALSAGLLSLPRGVPHVLRTASATFVLAGVGLIGLLSPLAVIAPVFTQPPLLVGRAGQFAPPNPVTVVYGDSIELVGYAFPTAKTSRSGTTSILLYWRVLRPIIRPYTLRIESFSVDGTSFGSYYESQPAQGAFPTTQWRPEDIYMEGYYWPIYDHVALPTIATFRVSWLDVQTGSLLPATCDTGASCEPRIGRLPVAMDAQEASEWSSLKACCRLGQDIELLAAHAPAQVAAGQPLSVSLVWRALAAGLPDRTVFVHLLSGDGHGVAQQDSPPRDGSYPTSVWSAGEIVPDMLTVSLDSHVPAGDYWLAVGMYDTHTLGRLPAAGADGRPLENGLIQVQKVHVAPGP